MKSPVARVAHLVEVGTAKAAIALESTVKAKASMSRIDAKLRGSTQARVCFHISSYGGGVAEV